MKILLDTNVLIDALQDNYAYTWRIIDLILQDKIQAVASDKIVKEYNLIISRNVVRQSDKEKLENFIAKCEIVQPTKRIKVIQDDPEDDKFIECAAEAKVNYIISSDRHLLNLEKYHKTKILSPQDFWLKYSNENSDEHEWKNTFKNILGI